MVAKEGLTSAERGTLLHLLLSRVDLEAEINADYLKELIAYLEANKFIAADAADGLRLQGVLDFTKARWGNDF